MPQECRCSGGKAEDCAKSAGRAPPDMKPVFAILKGRVIERLAELQAEAVSKPN